MEFLLINVEVIQTDAKLFTILEKMFYQIWSLQTILGVL